MNNELWNALQEYDPHSKVIGFWRKTGFCGFLSQWYSSTFTENDITFNSAEQYMMYHKALLFNTDNINDYIITKILEETKQPTIKKLGRKVKNFNGALWDEHKRTIIYKGNYLKFTQNEHLKNKLIETGNTILAEASPYDNIYGIGLGPNDKNIQDITKWRGQNLLGIALMMVRHELFET